MKTLDKLKRDLSLDKSTLNRIKLLVLDSILTKKYQSDMTVKSSSKIYFGPVGFTKAILEIKVTKLELISPKFDTYKLTVELFSSSEKLMHAKFIMKLPTDIDLFYGNNKDLYIFIAAIRDHYLNSIIKDKEINIYIPINKSVKNSIEKRYLDKMKKISDVVDHQLLLNIIELDQPKKNKLSLI